MGKRREINKQGELQCKDCEEWLHIDQFYCEPHHGLLQYVWWAEVGPPARAWGRPSSYCKACSAIRQREYSARYRAHKADKARFAAQDDASLALLFQREHSGPFDHLPPEMYDTCMRLRREAPELSDEEVLSQMFEKFGN